MKRELGCLCVLVQSVKKSRRSRLIKLFCCFGRDLNRKPQNALLSGTSNIEHSLSDDVPVNRVSFSFCTYFLNNYSK